MTGESAPTTRDAILAQYRPIRASIQAVLAHAVSHCKKADFDRAAKQLNLMDEAQLEDERIFTMLCDVALFESNQRGRRVFDGFVRDRLVTLGSSEQDLARRMSGAFVSIFRVADRHEHAGVWLEDLLAAGRRLWLLDESFEASAPEDMVIGMRLFDVGPFHAGFGIIVEPQEDLVAFGREAAARGARLPLRVSLAASLYADDILARSLPVVEHVEVPAAVVEALLRDVGLTPGPPVSATYRSRRRRR